MPSSCCQCQTPAAPVCRTQITSADLATLLYVQGLDANLCEKFAPIANLLQFRDCAGNIIAANSQIVTCAAFAAQLCTTLATLASGGEAVLGVTQVVGADCQTYVIPETPLVAIDTSTIDFTTGGAFGHTLTGIVKVSAAPGNIITVNADGLFAAAAPDTTVIVGADGTCIDVNVVEGPADTWTITVTPIISPAAGNTLACTPQGLFASPSSVAVADTNTVNLTVVGAPGSQVITADVIVSPDPGNDIEIHPNGIFVDVCAELAATTPAGVAVPGITQLVGRDCNAYTIPATPAETPIVVIDTSCINLTASGIGNHTLQADLTISPAPGNAAVCTPLGLFVPVVSSADFNVTVTDTPCLDLSVTEAPVGTFNISGTPVVSPVPGNALQCTAQGLFVESNDLVQIVPVDTPCIDIQVNEAPAGVFAISAVPVISPAANNALSCTAQGLFAALPAAGDTIVLGGSTPCATNVVVEAPPGTFTVTPTVDVSPSLGNALVCQANGLFVPDVSIVGTDTECINITVTTGGGGNFNISAIPILADAYPGFPVGCQSLQCTPTGLATPPDHDGNQASTPRFPPAVHAGSVAQFDVFQGPDHLLNIVNPSACRSAVVTLHLAIGQMNTSGTAGDYAIAAVYQNDLNLPGVAVTGGFIDYATQEITDTLAAGTDTPLTTLTRTFTVPPGFAGTVNVHAIYSVNDYGGAPGALQVFLGDVFAEYTLHTI